jgi:hypothetical protein
MFGRNTDGKKDENAVGGLGRMGEALCCSTGGCSAEEPVRCWNDGIALLFGGQGAIRVDGPTSCGEAFEVESGGKMLQMWQGIYLFLEQPLAKKAIQGTRSLREVRAQGAVYRRVEEEQFGSAKEGSGYA